MNKLAESTGCYTIECYTKGGILDFCWYFAPCRSRNKLGFGYTTLFLDPKQNPTYKAALVSTDLKIYDVICDSMIREHGPRD